MDLSAVSLELMDFCPIIITRGYDEPEILPYANHLNLSPGAGPGHEMSGA